MAQRLCPEGGEHKRCIDVEKNGNMKMEEIT